MNIVCYINVFYTILALAYMPIDVWHNTPVIIKDENGNEYIVNHLEDHPAREFYYQASPPFVMLSISLVLCYSVIFLMN